MIPVQSFVKFILILAVSFLLSCVKDSTKSGEVATAPTAVNRVIGNNVTAADFPARTQSIISLSYTSLDNELASSCSISQTSNVTVTQACSCDGVGVCMVGVTGVGANTGAGSFSYNVVAGGKTSTTGRATFNITAPPAGSNVPPTISALGAKSTTEGIAVSSTFTVADSDSTVTCSNVTATSSNTTVLPTANVVITGSGTNCTVTTTPAANQVGSSNIILTLTDTGTPLPAQTAVSSFTLTVNSFNDPPTISSITSQITNEDTSLTGVAFTIADVDSTLSCSNVTAVSSNTALVANGNISISGSAPNCTISMSPTLNQNGSTNITLTVTDNGMPLPAKTATTSFALTVVSVNDAPVIAPISTQNTTENIAKAVSFTITDVDSVLSCSSSVVVTSSNTTLVPNTNIALSGIAPNCVATVTPVSGLHGSTNLTITVSDNGFPMPIQSASATFALNVAQVNHAPTISSITAQSTNEDTATSAIAFTIADSDSTVYCSNVAGTSANTTLVPNANIVITGTAPNCVATITPAANGYGSATITLTLTDNGTPMPGLTATSVFNLTVNAVNDAPTISAITTKTTAEGSASAPIAYTINDIDSTLSCASSVTATSSNTTLIPNANIAFSGTAPNCTIVITPAAVQYGTATITLTVTDNGTPLPALTATTSFTMNVTQVNQAPTISAITSKTTNEDTATTAIAFTIGDSDSTVYCNDVYGTSNNTTLIPNANIVVTGTAPNCTATITPAANAYGSANITLTITDNGTPPPALMATSFFALTVSAVNDAPTISAITTKTTAEGSASSAIAFTIADIDSTLSCASSMTMTSSNTTLIPNANVVFAGTAPNCTAVVTPASSQYGSATLTFTVTDGGTPLPALTATSAFTMNVTQVNQAPNISAITSKSTNEDTASSAIAFTIGDSDSTVYCNNVAGTSDNTTLIPNANIVITGTAPNCTATITPAANGYGTANITLTLTDNGTPAPALTATTSFALTVNAVNDAPTISAITTKTTTEATASSAIAFTIADIDSTLSCASSMSMTSSNTTLIPNANVVFAGTAPNCTAVVTPASGQYGSATLTFTVTDGGTPLPAATATSAFTMNVTQVNQAPTISAITSKTTNEDTATSAIAFTIADTDSTVYCNNVVGTSSNTTLIPNANIVIAGTAPNCTATITPVANGNGTANITLTLTDNGTPAPALTATSVFALTVTAVNDAPTISAITAKSTDEDTASSAIAFTIADVDSTLTCSGSVAGTSSNTTIVPNANIVISGTAPNCTAVITPAANKNGSATITLTVTDNGTPMPALTATTSFALTVVPVPDLSGTLTVASNLSGIASSYSGNSYARTIIFTGITSDEALSSVEVCLGTASGSCDVSSWVTATGYTTSGSAPSVTLGGSYKMKSGVGGAQTFTLAASCGTTTNYYYSVRGTNSSSRISNIISTPAWTFWEPTCLGSNLAQWLDSSETSTMTFSAATVTAWADKSINARDVTAVSGKVPSYSATALGTGLSGVTFAGAQALTRASFVYAQGSSSVFVVLKAAASTLKSIFSEGSTTTNNYSYSPMMSSSTNTVTGSSYNAASTYDFNVPTTSTTFFDNTIRFAMAEDTGSTYYTYSNGTAQSQAATSYTRTPTGTSFNTYRLGSRFRNNADTAGTLFTGAIGEFMVTNGVLSTLNRQKLEGYSAHKWGVNANLPAAHPYLTSPP